MPLPWQPMCLTRFIFMSEPQPAPIDTWGRGSLGKRAVPDQSVFVAQDCITVHAPGAHVPSLPVPQLHTTELPAPRSFTGHAVPA